VADAQADYDHALAGLQHQANAAWDEYAQAMEAAGCPPAGGPIQFVAHSWSGFWGSIRDSIGSMQDTYASLILEYWYGLSDEAQAMMDRAYQRGPLGQTESSSGAITTERAGR
jgi:hypothetical protein